MERIFGINKERLNNLSGENITLYGIYDLKGFRTLSCNKNYEPITNQTVLIKAEVLESRPVGVKFNFFNFNKTAIKEVDIFTVKLVRGSIKILEKKRVWRGFLE